MDGKTILLMDDHPGVLRGLSSYLGAMLPGCSVVTLNRFNEGDDLPAKVDIAILDVVMPRSMGVHDRVRLIRKIYGPNCLILCQSMTMDDDDAFVLRLNGADYAVEKDSRYLTEIFEKEGLI